MTGFQIRTTSIFLLPARPGDHEAVHFGHMGSASASRFRGPAAGALDRREAPLFTLRRLDRLPRQQNRQIAHGYPISTFEMPFRWRSGRYIASARAELAAQRSD